MKEKNKYQEVFEKLNLLSLKVSKSRSVDDLNNVIFETLNYCQISKFEAVLWECNEEENYRPVLFSTSSTKRQEKERFQDIVPTEFLKKSLSITQLQSDDNIASIENHTISYHLPKLMLIPAKCGEKVSFILSILSDEERNEDTGFESIIRLLANLIANKYEHLNIAVRQFSKLEDYIYNEAFNKSVVEYGSDIIIILDPKGIILYLNPSSKETLGYDPEFLVGKSFFDFIRQKHQELLKKGFEESFATKKEQKIEYQFICADGKYKYLESNSINLKDKEGVEGLILDCRDITEKIKTNNELKKQRQFIQQVIDTDPNLIYVKDEEGKFHLINDAVAELHGASKTEVIEMLNEKAKAKPEELYNESKEDADAIILKGEEIIVEESFTMPNGEIKWFQTTKKALPPDEGAIQMLSISVDITQRKKDAEELLSVQKAKEQFLANMSHEIRTPINGIAGLINLLAETNPTLDQKKYLNGIQSSAQNLKVIINDILDISKIESGKLNFEKIGFMPESQISSVIETFKYRTDEKGLQLSYHVETAAKTLLMGDPVRLNQILMNLIGNAVKFTYAGYIKIYAAMNLLDEGKALMTFTVSDSGIGIPDDKIDSIFDSFKQADESVTRRYGGTGLGLAICKQLVELQGGEIEVQSKESTGTAFKFTIPYELASEEEISKLNPNTESKLKIKELGSFEKLSILLVEDNDINQMYCSNILKKWNCKVEIAANGYIALEKIKKNAFDLILMDIQMPVMDGFETTRNIRNNLESPISEIPIIALTANAIKGDNVKCLEVGMDDYLPKPFVPEELFNKIIKLTKIKPIDHSDEGFVVKTNVNKIDIEGNKPIVDLSYLKDISDNDEEFIKDMILSFLENSPNLMNQMSEAAEKQQWEEVAKVAHKIKPSIVFMGINSIKDVVETIESNGYKKIDTESIPDLIKKLRSTVDRAHLELKKEKVITQ